MSKASTARDAHHTNTCPICGEPVGDRLRAKYCSRDCYKAAARERYREKKGVVLREVPCTVCGKHFTQKNHRQKCCGQECSTKYWSNIYPTEKRARIAEQEPDLMQAYRKDHNLAVFMARRGFPQARKAVAA